MPTSEYRARKLMERGRAVIHQYRPFTIMILTAEPLSLAWRNYSVYVPQTLKMLCSVAKDCEWGNVSDDEEIRRKVHQEISECQTNVSVTDRPDKEGTAFVIESDQLKQSCAELAFIHRPDYPTLALRWAVQARYCGD